MKNEYDLFEKFPNGSSLWRASFLEFETTFLQLHEIGPEIRESILRDQLDNRRSFYLQLGTRCSWIRRAFRNRKTKQEPSCLGKS